MGQIQKRKLMDKDDMNTTVFIAGGIVILIAIVWIICALSMPYGVWSARKKGEAELAHAESNRQIKTLEAKAAEESAKHLSAAEVTRARGVAEANKIIGDSLKGNESYLRYLWIEGLQHTSGQVVYIPTEANLPILEAGKR
jgi:hypothetical protein